MIMRTKETADKLMMLLWLVPAQKAVYSPVDASLLIQSVLVAGQGMPMCLFASSNCGFDMTCQAEL